MSPTAHASMDAASILRTADDLTAKDVSPRIVAEFVLTAAVVAETERQASA